MSEFSPLEARKLAQPKCLSLGPDCSQHLLSVLGSKMVLQVTWEEQLNYNQGAGVVVFSWCVGSLHWLHGEPLGTQNLTDTSLPDQLSWNFWTWGFFKGSPGSSVQPGGAPGLVYTLLQTNARKQRLERRNDSDNQQVADPTRTFPFLTDCSETLQSCL